VALVVRAEGLEDEVLGAFLRTERVHLAELEQWRKLHSGIRFVTPAQRHHGADVAIQAHRHEIYTAARMRHPERWTGSTRNWARPELVALNPEPVRGERSKAN
jgi:hypothetical protein